MDITDKVEGSKTQNFSKEKIVYEIIARIVKAF